MTKWWLASLLLTAGLLTAQPRKTVEPNWTSLAVHEAPAWLADAKFGVYAHWGVYSVPAFGNEWYGKRIYDPNDKFGTYEHHRKSYGTQCEFGFRELVSQGAEGLSFEAPAVQPGKYAHTFKITT